jgi:metal-dependent amidase/aminoacylase/carboxypeptidase family protein
LDTETSHWSFIHALLIFTPLTRRSPCEVHGGNVGNIVPGKVWLQGTCRFFDPALSDHCARLIIIEEITHGIATAHGVLSKLEYKTGYPPAINTFEAVTNVLEAAASALGGDNVIDDFMPSLGCEDFAFMVRAATGCYAWAGTGEVGPGQGLHGDRYVFNDGIVPTVLRYWVCLVERVLSASQ